MSKKEKVSLVLGYLKKNRLMTLGTASGDNKPWAATVFFAYDEKLNIVFFSREDTRHCMHIKKNHYVSVAVNHEWRQRGGLVRGIQMTGRASKLSGKERDRYYALYRSRFKWADDFASDHALYLVRPREVWYIDQKIFGHFHRVRIV